MTTVYLIWNNETFQKLIAYKTDLPYEAKLEQLPLSRKGEKLASNFTKHLTLQETSHIYSSNYNSMINTAKYLSETLDLPIHIDERLKERKIGILGNNSEEFLREKEIHDFDYKLHNGESLNQVQERMKSFLKEILAKHKEETITLFTHEIAIQALLCVWCEKGFNLENQLILNFKENVIMDGAYHAFGILKLKFDDMKLKEIEWINDFT